ncbi:MAG: 2-phosphosulfolactate phosphatase, partial [Thermoguttaceae bacterium]|nr:2-phosphosulfolactate phosphatase [Thermoguttaceae bacterium]
MKKIDVYPLPDLAPELPFNGVSVAVDVLRATTTIATALAAGAEKVLPFETIEETLAAKRAVLAARPGDEDRVKLGGERKAVPIDGFDFGNSPDQYVPETIADKTLLFTTTNGTRAMFSCRGT